MTDICSVLQVTARIDAALFDEPIDRVSALRQKNAPRERGEAFDNLLLRRSGWRRRGAFGRGRVARGLRPVAA